MTMKPDTTVQPTSTRPAPRVAFLPDSFHEVNGVAHTARNFTAYAQRHGLPFLCIRAALPGVRGPATITTEGTVTSVNLPRSRAAIAMEKDLSFDPLFARHHSTIERTLREFKPDILHITGPSELGIFGAYFAWKMGIPLAASWHTNVHEYAGRRAAKLGARAAGGIEAASLLASTRFYRLARVLYAPNEELCMMLQQRTHRPCHVMRRGVDTDLFAPARRTRTKDGTLLLGYVGRLSVEKNIAMLPRIQAALHEAGITNTKFVIVGHGGDEASLRASMPTAEFAGVLRGEALAQAYANMDIFVFPSDTDTFGNVVLEALASGIPAVVTTGGGPKFIVQDGVTGFVRTPSHMAECVALLARDTTLRERMAAAARDYALSCRWDAIFDGVYQHYPAAARPNPA